MPLSEREQKLLQQLEQQLNADDPQFATSMSETGTSRFSTRRIVIGSICAALGLGVLLWGVSQQWIWLGLIGFVIMAAGVYVASTREGATRRRGGESAKGGQDRPKRPSPFMANLEERWEERRRQEP